MKIISRTHLTVTAVACSVLAGSIAYTRSAAADQAAPASLHPEQSTTITINGETTAAPPNQPLSRTFSSQDGATRIDVSVNSHSSGNAQSNTDVSIRTDGSSNTERTITTEEYYESP